jgi:hypothetical protein
MISALLTLALCQAGPVLSVRVEGEGFLRFEREGRMVFARQAVLTVARGQLVHAKGQPVMPSIEGFRPSEGLAIASNGEVRAVAGSGSTRTLGRLTLAIFPPDIRPVESAGFLVAADRPAIAYPGTAKAGTILSLKPGEDAFIPTPPTQPIPRPNPQPAGSAKTTPSASVTLKEKAEVEGDTVTLGDIADLSGPEDLVNRLRGLDLGSTPSLGVTRPIDRSAVEARIARGGILLASLSIQGGPKSSVVRRGQTITPEQFLQAAREAVQEEVQASLTLEASEPGQPMAVPLGEAVLKAENASLIKDLASATIAVFVDGRRINSRTIKMKAVSPLSAFKPGQTVTIRVKSGGASVQTTGRIRSLNIPKGEVTVESATGAVLIGTPAKDGSIEVKL